jgi:MFS transporter, DHA2 family, multidrug resistance protein
MVLDKGQELDWFGSRYITVGTIIAVSILIVWIFWEWRHPHPIVELQLLKKRNFAAAMFSMLILGGVLYGTTVLLPEFLQDLMGYPAVAAGEALAAGGFLMMVTMPISGQLTQRVDPRMLMSFGFLATSLGLYHMATHLSLGMDFRTASLLRVYQVAGLAFIFIPSNVLCYQGIPREKNNQVSSMMNFVRNIGGSIGIALVSTMLTRSTQRRQNYLAANLQNGNPVFRQRLEGITSALHNQGLSVAQAAHAAYARIGLMLDQQASAIAFKDVVATLAIVVTLLIPLPFLMEKDKRGNAPPPVH